MTIELTPRQERLLHDAMQQGRFHSVDEALDEALRSIARPEVPTASRRDRVVRKVSEMSAAELELIANSEMDPRHNHLDAELE